MNYESPDVERPSAGFKELTDEQYRQTQIQIAIIIIVVLLIRFFI